MHHVYARRIVIALVVFFALSSLLFGAVVTALRAGPSMVATAPVDDSAGEENASEEGAANQPVTLPDGRATFERQCSSCHQVSQFANKLSDSLDPDAVSQGQLEKLVGPPAHGGASPVEAVAVVLYFRDRAGLSTSYPESVPTPPAAATAAAAIPVPTPVRLGTSLSDYEGIWTQQCSTCHQAEKFAEGLKAEADPDLRTRQAIEFLSGPPEHRNRPVVTFLPAMNYVRQLAGLEPLQ